MPTAHSYSWRNHDNFRFTHPRITTESYINIVLPSTIIVDGNLSNMAKKHVLCLRGEQCDWDIGIFGRWGPMMTSRLHIPDLRPAAVECDCEALTCQKKSKCTVQNIIDFLILANTEVMFFIVSLEKKCEQLTCICRFKEPFLKMLSKLWYI